MSRDVVHTIVVAGLENFSKVTHIFTCPARHCTCVFWIGNHLDGHKKLTEIHHSIMAKFQTKRSWFIVYRPSEVSCLLTMEIPDTRSRTSLLAVCHSLTRTKSVSSDPENFVLQFHWNWATCSVPCSFMFQSSCLAGKYLRIYTCPDQNFGCPGLPGKGFFEPWVVVTLFIQGGPFSYKAGIQRGPV